MKLGGESRLGIRTRLPEGREVVATSAKLTVSCDNCEFMTTVCIAASFRGTTICCKIFAGQIFMATTVLPSAKLADYFVPEMPAFCQIVCGCRRTRRQPLGGVSANRWTGNYVEWNDGME